MADVGSSGPAGRAAPKGIALLLLLIPLPIYFFRLDHVAGLIVDDAWYVLLARGLAAGAGYRLTNAPFETAVLPMYPPGFPALLSGVFWIDPAFPHNVWMLKAVSIAAMLATAPLSYAYLHRYRHFHWGVAACGALLVATTPALVFAATSTTMSEPVFTLAQLGAVFAAHRSMERSDGHAWRWVLLAAIVGAAAFFIRSTGIAALIAVLASYAVHRQWKRACGYAAIVAICVLPWLLYSQTRKPTEPQQQLHRGNIMYSYQEQFWMHWAGSPSSGRATAADLPGRVGRNFVDVFGRGIGGLFVPVFLRGPDESGEELIAIGGSVGWTFVGLGNSVPHMAISFTLAAMLAWGFVCTVRRKLTVAEILVPLSLVVTLAWPWWSFRFLVPLMPFLVVYAARAASSLPAAGARIVLLTLVGLNLYDHAGYIHLRRSSPSSIDWLNQSDEAEKTLKWMSSHLEPGGLVATTNPPLVHMWTGHKSVTLDSMAEQMSNWHERGVRYVAPMAAHELPDDLIGPHQLLYSSCRTPSACFWVAEIE